MIFLQPVNAQSLTFVELNCENLFDLRHDEGKNDQEFMEGGARRWSRSRYWTKINNISKELLASDSQIPDLVALIEVENDSVLRDLTRRGLLRNLNYRYLMTESPDMRGIDVALMYNAFRFLPLCYDYLEVPVIGDMHPTRDILYVMGKTVTQDTLHVFVVHSPSRYGGEKKTRPYRMNVVKTLMQAINRIGEDKLILVAGDFNDYADSPALTFLNEHGLINATAHARGTNGAKGTYRYKGRWESLDHVLLSPTLYNRVDTTYINDLPALMEDEPVYGGKQPKRTYRGYRYQKGYSDHLPLIVRFLLKK